jgi:hypothetical protein
MKRLPAALLILVATNVAAQRDTSALVEASKNAKSKRKTSTTKVITNDDVKKSKGKLVEKPGEAQPDPEPQPTLAEKHETDRAARLEREAKIAAADKKVNELTKELERIEQAYYEENDLDRRDEVIAKQFEETKKKLDDAKKALEDLLH